jgi:hypothetical protein
MTLCLPHETVRFAGSASPFDRAQIGANSVEFWNRYRPRGNSWCSLHFALGPRLAHVTEQRRRLSVSLRRIKSAPLIARRWPFDS